MTDRRVTLPAFRSNVGATAAVGVGVSMAATGVWEALAVDLTTGEAVGVAVGKVGSPDVGTLDERVAVQARYTATTSPIPIHRTFRRMGITWSDEQ